MIARVQPDLTSMLAAQGGGASRWFDATMTVNARQLEIDALQADSRARYDLELWRGSRRAAASRRRMPDLPPQPIRRLLFRSNRDGRDAAAILGGGVSNRWDLPRRADGEPFGFTGTIEVFALIADTAGFHVLCLASAPRANDVAGFALENVYLKVRPPARLALLAHGDSAAPGPSGIAVLSLRDGVGRPDPARSVRLESASTPTSALRSSAPCASWSHGSPACPPPWPRTSTSRSGFPSRRLTSRATRMRRACGAGSSATLASSASRFGCWICQPVSTCSGWRSNHPRSSGRPSSTTG